MALAALLPIIQAIAPHLLGSGAAAGTAATVTGGAAAVGATTAGAASAGLGSTAAGATAGLSGGLNSLIAQFTGSVQGFGSATELGGAVQKANDIAGTIANLQAAMGGLGEKQTDLANGARYTDPATGMEIDNSGSTEHLEKLAALEKERAAMMQQEKSMRSQLVDLNTRIGQTNNPRSPMDSLGAIGGLAGGAAASLDH